MRLAETYHFHWMFYDVMAQPEMREMFQRRIDYDRWIGGKFKWPIPIREFWDSVASRNSKIPLFLLFSHLLSVVLDCLQQPLGYIKPLDLWTGV